MKRKNSFTVGKSSNKKLFGLLYTVSILHTERYILQHYSRHWELISMGIGTSHFHAGCSHYHSNSHDRLIFCPIPMGFPWDCHSHWESHSYDHLYWFAHYITLIGRIDGELFCYSALYGFGMDCAKSYVRFIASLC